jgi:sporulation protein YlmC with PRC-barrel domain
MTRFTETTQRKVVDVESAHQVAEVAGLVVDAREKRVALVRVREVAVGDGSLVDWDALRAFGRDAVTVETAAAIHVPRDEREERAARGELDLPHRRVLTERGHELGCVQDVEFDPTTGEVVAMYTQSARVAGARLLGIGAYAVTVRDG